MHSSFIAYSIDHVPTIAHTPVHVPTQLKSHKHKSRTSSSTVLNPKPSETSMYHGPPTMHKTSMNDILLNNCV